MSTHRIRLVAAAYCVQCGSSIYGPMPFGLKDPTFIIGECLRCEVRFKVPIQYLDCVVVETESNI